MKLWQKDTIALKEVEKFTVVKDREMDLYLDTFDVLGSLAHFHVQEFDFKKYKQIIEVFLNICAYVKLLVATKRDTKIGV